MRCAGLVLWGGLVGIVFAPAPGGAQAGGADTCARALIEIRDLEPLQLTRVAIRCGDHAILQLLDTQQPGAVRLAAIHASPWLAAPESALDALASALASRDSLLAPAAARAAVDIAARLDPQALERREIAPSELGQALAALRRVSESPHVRVELRMMAQRAATLLEVSGVPSARARAPT